MPFDGGFLHKIKQELEPMIGARVDKIGQPNRDCVVIHLHNRGPVRRLVILAGAAPRLHFSAIPIEYPATPPDVLPAAAQAPGRRAADRCDPAGAGPRPHPAL